MWFGFGGILGSGKCVRFVHIAAVMTVSSVGDGIFAALIRRSVIDYMHIICDEHRWENP